MKKPSGRKQMGDLLVEAGVLKETDLVEALRKQKTSKRPLGEILQEMGVICEKDIALVLTTQFNIRPAPPLTEKPLPQELLGFVDLPLATTRLVCPISREGSKLNLAMSNPLDLETIDNISFRTELKVVPWVSTPSEILTAIRHHYLGEVKTDNHELCKILVVEDKKTIRAAAVAVLKKEGYQVVEASSGKEGLDAVQLHSPHLILTETVMPRMDGCAMFRELQKNPETRHIPVIGFSSRASKSEEVSLLNMGFADFIPKPINNGLLSARVGRVLDLVYQGQGFSAKHRSEASEPASLYEATHTLLDLLQGSLEKNQTEKLPEK